MNSPNPTAVIKLAYDYIPSSRVEQNTQASLENGPLPALVWAPTKML